VTLRRKLIAVSACIQTSAPSWICNLMMNLEVLEKREWAGLKIRRWKGVIKVRAEMYEIGIKRIMQRINEMQNWFFENINKVDKHFAKLTKRKREESQIKNYRYITVDTSQSQRIIR
jgi:hypothetical protein